MELVRQQGSINDLKGRVAVAMGVEGHIQAKVFLRDGRKGALPVASTIQ
jgi:hypothetical protein